MQTLGTAFALAKALPVMRPQALGEITSTPDQFYTQAELKDVGKTNFWTGAAIFGLLGVIAGGIGGILLMSHFQNGSQTLRPRGTHEGVAAPSTKKAA